MPLTNQVHKLNNVADNSQIFMVEKKL